MKNLSLKTTAAILFVTIALMSGCMSSDQKKNDAKNRVTDARDKLEIAKNNENVVAQKAATADEIETFKLESELKIKHNEVSIAELKLKMNNPGSSLDEVTAKKIDSLEIRNKNLKTRIDSCGKTRTDWERFKRDFNRDMDELGRSLKDMTVHK